MTPNWSEDFELESRRHEAGTDAEQAEYDDAQALADDLADTQDDDSSMCKESDEGDGDADEG